VGGAARQADAGPQGLTHRIEAAEARQQGGVDVDQPLGEGLHQHRRHDPHPAGHHHEVDAGLLERGDQCAI
jgi:hypothetical protein